AEKAARRLHLTLAEFGAKLPELLARGFPGPDQTTGMYDLDAIDQWRAARHGYQPAGLTAELKPRDASDVFNARRGCLWTRWAQERILVFSLRALGLAPDEANARRGFPPCAPRAWLDCRRRTRARAERCRSRHRTKRGVGSPPPRAAANCTAPWLPDWQHRR